MTTIATILSDLETSAHPIARVLHKGDNFKVLVLGFNKGMILKEHKTNVTTKLTVIAGSVVYREAHRELTLALHDEVAIPIHVTHSVEALEDSLCLLCQG